MNSKSRQHHQVQLEHNPAHLKLNRLKLMEMLVVAALQVVLAVVEIQNKLIQMMVMTENQLMKKII